MADERLMTMNGDKVAALVISIVVVKPELRRLSCFIIKKDGTWEEEKAFLPMLFLLAVEMI